VSDTQRAPTEADRVLDERAELEPT
jgi:hypothetical protein